MVPVRPHPGCRDTERVRGALVVVAVERHPHAFRLESIVAAGERCLNLGRIAAEHPRADVHGVIVVQNRDTHAVAGLRAFARPFLDEVADPHRLRPRRLVEPPIQADRRAQPRRPDLFSGWRLARLQCDRGGKAQRDEGQSRASASNTRPRSYCELSDAALARMAARIVSSIWTLLMTASSSSDSS